ncbi:glycosyltransferase family 2 protein [Actinophytocola sp.]|uniref:glycosyltransferase family 2 protein n=1 Tax=Actinophytocola sp. TaxID=1872138 RepID=UPI002D80BF40|nr:glycosyltransferase family 2 protein [Actinophytocola sp.]HET9138248.1 glycosyltransferase family 2 protein [Actinophytocola sp.]
MEPQQNGNGAVPDEARTRSLVTLIAPALNEADNAAGLVAFYREIRAAHPELDFELIVVDDGSTDDTARLVLEALGTDDVARVISLSRNFGSHAAITAGLAMSRGDCALTLSTDLQEPLEAITRFLDAWRAGNDVVWGLRKTRAVPKGMSNLLSRLFSKAFHRMSTIPNYPKDGPSQILVSRAVIDVVNKMPEANRNVLGIFAWVGFTQTSISFEQLPRPAGQSKWTTRKKVKLLVDSFVEFSAAPFQITAVIGLLLGALGFAAILTLLIVALAGGPLTGWGLVLGTVVLLAGVQLTVLGGFGEYLWRAGDDARHRPVYVLRAVQDVGRPGARPAVSAEQPAGVSER